MTLKLIEGNLKILPKHKMWITRTANEITLIIYKSVNYQYMLQLMK